jgi:hypothetical protein
MEDKWCLCHAMVASLFRAAVFFEFGVAFCSGQLVFLRDGGRTRQLSWDDL